jgi:signal transduction histidine kinase
MASYLERAILPLARLGVIDLLVFFLVLTIVFVFLEKTRIFGKNKKNISIVFSACTALMFINLVPGSLFLPYFAWFVLAFVAAISLTMMTGFFGIESNVYKMASLSFFGIAILFIIAQFIKSEFIMQIILGFAILGVVVAALTVSHPAIFFGAVGANIVLSVMAISLGMQSAVEDVYLSGISLGILFFSVLIWWILGGDYSAGRFMSSGKSAASNSFGKSGGKPLAKEEKKKQKEKKEKEEIKERAKRPTRDLPKSRTGEDGDYEKKWRKTGKDLDEFLSGAEGVDRKLPENRVGEDGAFEKTDETFDELF